jgi:hypothetical protein
VDANNGFWGDGKIEIMKKISFGFLFLFLIFSFVTVPVYGITPPTDLLPADGVVVTNPVAFSWAPGQGNRAIYLNVATNSDFNPINVINWQDDGSHFYVEENTAKFQKGQTYYYLI